MTRYTRRRRRNRRRKKRPKIETAPGRKRNYLMVGLIAFPAGGFAAFIGWVADAQAAFTLGVVGFILGCVGGMAILFGESLPARRGTEQASQNYQGGSKFPEIDEILK